MDVKELMVARHASLGRQGYKTGKASKVYLHHLEGDWYSFTFTLPIVGTTFIAVVNGICTFDENNVHNTSMFIMDRETGDISKPTKQRSGATGVDPTLFEI